MAKPAISMFKVHITKFEIQQTASVSLKKHVMAAQNHTLFGSINTWHACPLQLETSNLESKPDTQSEGRALPKKHSGAHRQRIYQQARPKVWVTLFMIILLFQIHL